MGAGGKAYERVEGPDQISRASEWGVDESRMREAGRRKRDSCGRIGRGVYCRRCELLGLTTMMGDSGCRLNVTALAGSIHAPIRYLPTTNSDSDTHNHIRVHRPQRLVLSNKLTEIHVTDDGRVQQQERYLGVDDLHGIQFTQGVTCRPGKRV